MRPATTLPLLLVLTMVASLAGAILAPPSADAAPTHYVEMSDGVLIAINVEVPEHCTTEDPCPTVVEMAGYENGSADGRTPSGDIADAAGIPTPLQCGSRCSHSTFFDDRYVTIQASVRGTGCSTGEFDLFSWRSALDGKELIDGWIAHQPWSDGRVAIFGHSYSGLTGTLVAATQPEHLVAMSVSGLIDDLYRGIVYPGGVSNYGFPLLWTGVVRPLYDVGGGVGGGLFPPAETSDECATNQTRRSQTVLNQAIIQGLADTDNDWYRTRSLITWIGRIEVPIHITGAYQDEQTGPRGPAHLFEHLPTDIPRRLVLTNGDHGTQTNPHVRPDRVAWLDYWVLGRDRDEGLGDLRKLFGPRNRATSTVRILLGHKADGTFEGVLDSTAFPLTQTRWVDLFYDADGTMTTRLDDVDAGSLSWFNGSKRQSYSYQAGADNGGQLSSPTGPDELEFRWRVPKDVVLSGPITTNLRVVSSTPDTELFVQLIDRAPTGELLYLQRGMLRASHRAIWHEWSDRNVAGRIYRPHRPHTNPTGVTPGEPVDYLVEIFPVSHVLREGHELIVKIHAPPADDNDYMYVPRTPPGMNTLVVDPEHPSWLMLPLVPMSDVKWPSAPPEDPCGYNEMRCVPQ